MEILHEINPALEALAYLGSRANGHTLDRLEERLQARGVRKAEPFHRASAALRELLKPQVRRIVETHYTKDDADVFVRSRFDADEALFRAFLDGKDES